MRRPPQRNSVHPRAAGSDVGSPFPVVAVPPDLSPAPVHTVQRFPGDLSRLADWRGAIGGTTGAMASTGLSGMPVFAILAAPGLAVLLGPARQVKNVPGRTTEGNEAPWIPPLHHYG